jgi:hypothetical protein
MTTKDILTLRNCYSALREFVIRNPGGSDDADMRAKVERLCEAGAATLDDAEVRERLRSVLWRARDMYSSDGHRKWERPHMSGAEYLRLQILIDLEGLNTRLFFIDARRERASAQELQQLF